MVAFTPEYLSGLAEAFNEGAFDLVPFQLATVSGGHTHDPARWRGDVYGLEVVPDGLDALIMATDELWNGHVPFTPDAFTVPSFWCDATREFPLAPCVWCYHLLEWCYHRGRGIR